MAPSFLEALRVHALARPSAPFCMLLQHGTWHELTYGDVARDAKAFAALYRTIGLRQGEVVLIVLDHRHELFGAFLGAGLAGCVPSFMPFPSQKQQPARFWETHGPLFDRIGHGAIVTWKEHASVIREVLGDRPIRLIVPEEAHRYRSDSVDLSPCAPNLDDAALLQHSSGTTGMKKGVVLSYRTIAEQAEAVARAVQLEPQDCIASWLPLYHDMGLIACFLLPLTLGARVAAIDAFQWVARPHLLLDAIERHRATHVWMPNFAFQHLCRTLDPDARWDLSHVKALINCSEPCKAETFDMFEEHFASSGIHRRHLQVAYGMAEAVFCLTQTPVGHPVTEAVVDAEELERTGRAVRPRPGARLRRILSVGRAIAGADFKVVDEDHADLPDDRVGEVVVSGKYLFSGYFRNAEETARKMRDGLYLSGDLGFVRDGELYVMGRRDDRLIVYGKNFFAHDIEQVATSVAGVKPGRCVALGLYSEDLGSEEVVLIAEPMNDDVTTHPALREAVKAAVLAQLNLSLRDVRIVPRGWVIKTTSGKMDRADNSRKYLANFGPSSSARQCDG